jgi:hypothetical protein
MRTLTVSPVERLARSTEEMQGIVYDLSGGGSKLKATEQPVDTGTAVGGRPSTC